MLSILTKQTLQKDLQNCLTKMCFLDKGKKQQYQTKKKIKQKLLPEPGIEPGTS